jgi:hypothetical protein
MSAGVMSFLENNTYRRDVCRCNAHSWRTTHILEMSAGVMLILGEQHRFLMFGNIEWGERIYGPNREEIRDGFKN